MISIGDITKEMVLSDSAIKAGRTQGKIIIEPYDENSLTSCAYDVRLGTYLIRSRYRVQSWLEWLWAYWWGTPPTNPWSESYHYWSTPETPTQQDGIDGFVLQPGELVLGHTEEFIGSTRGSEITTMMKARSSIGRIGLTVCACAGLGDVNYHSRWCMEIKNHSDMAIFLPVGVRVAQIIFFLAEGATQDYTDKGHYQSSDDLDEIRDSWSPHLLYPRLYQNSDAPRSQAK